MGMGMGIVLQGFLGGSVFSVLQFYEVGSIMNSVILRISCMTDLILRKRVGIS